MSTLAVFLLLGGTTYAAAKINGSRLKDRSVSGKKLKNNSVYGAKLRANSVDGTKLKAATVSGARIAPNTLTSREINNSKIGTVPKASSADNAGKVDGKDAAQLVAKCPSGTTDLGSACAETAPRAGAIGYEAARVCTAAGGYLPGAAELVGADRANKINVGADEWSSSWSGTSGTTVSGGGVSGAQDVSSAVQPYRCFFSLRER